MIDKSKLKAMTDVVSHRGPNGEGHWVNETGNVGFGHRRLSIIDLSESGHQPMHYLDRYTITFNGEIYNYIELRNKLISKGHKFKSLSDTEILLAMYAEYDKEMLPYLDGMFSFAIWDNVSKKMFCARDRFGEKPFFYFLNKNKFVFGSEMKTIWAFGIEKRVDDDRLFEYITDGKIEKPNYNAKTYFKNINQLNPANYLMVNEVGEVEVCKYWDLNSVTINKELSFGDAKNRYFELFKESIKKRLRSDVAVGSSLSGGLDSSSIVCLIDQLKNKDQIQKVFSARFKDFINDEGQFIEEVVKKCGSVESFYTWPSNSDITDEMEKIVWHQEEPFGSASIVAQWKVMELAKKENVTVLLDGQGADEYLGGYLSEYKIYLNQLYYIDRKKYEKELKAFNSHFGQRKPLVHNKVNETLRIKLGRYKRNILHQSFDILTLKQRLKSLLSENGLRELLRYSDRNAMAHSVEVRLPFLSHELVEFVYSLPDEFIINNGWTKYIHRCSMENIVPKDICWRIDKIGFESPQKSWINNSLVRERINSQKKKYCVNDSVMGKESNYDSVEWRLFISSFF